MKILKKLSIIIEHVCIKSNSQGKVIKVKFNKNLIAIWILIISITSKAKTWKSPNEFALNAVIEKLNEIRLSEG